MSTAKTDSQSPQRFSDEWETKRLGNVAHIKTGSKNNEDKDENGQYPLFVRSAIVERINSYCYDGEAILVPGEGGIESVFHYINGRFDCHQRVYMINRFMDDVCGKLVYYCMVLQFGSHALKNTVKATVDSLRLPTFENFSFLISKDVSEQRAIAKALSDVDGLLNALDALIAKKQAIKQATMQQLLTGKTRLPGFSGGWETKQLGDVSDIDPENFSSNTIPDYKFNYISLEQVDSGKLLGYSEEILRTAPSRARRILRNGDVLMSTVRPNLMAHLFFQNQIPNAVCSTGFAVLRAKCDLSVPYFLFAQLFSKGVNDQITKILAGSNYPAINSRDVKLIEIPCPSQISEQRAIASVLSDMEAEIAALEQRRDKTLAIKRGMMQQLLTGRVRLVKLNAIE